METPIFDFVQRYWQSGTTRFHMPGHKGQPILGCEPFDITEISGADNLQDPVPGGIIAQSEQNATALFGTASTYYSTGGSSSCIGAMLYLAKLAAPTQRQGSIMAGRNAHKVFLQTCALLDMQPTWLTPAPEQAQGLCSCIISPLVLEQELASAQRADALPMAVYITSPDYLGNLADVAGLAAVCKQYQLPLLVDNAHGAYLKFLQPSQHPIDLGATICCDSAHKTLPVLTGGAYLHLAEPQPQAKFALSLFSSTSPSYLILQSLDVCNAMLADDFTETLAQCVHQISQCKETLVKMGYRLCQGEPLKITIDCRGMSLAMQGQGQAVQCGGTMLASALRAAGIEPEFADPDFLVLMATPNNTQEDFIRLETALRAIAAQGVLDQCNVPSPQYAPKRHQVTHTLRQAIFAKSEEIAIEDAVGRTCCTAQVACPPAIPIVISGEVITKEDICLFRYYDIKTIHVIKEER